jgi:hypothetical protein
MTLKDEILTQETAKYKWRNRIISPQTEMPYVWKTAWKLSIDDNITLYTQQLVELNWGKGMRSDSTVYIIQMRKHSVL